MGRIPDVTYTPDGPTYEGRLLDRADEEVVDQGAPFDIRTLVTRRGVIGVMGTGVGLVALSACSGGEGSTSSGSSSASSSSSEGGSAGTSGGSSTSSSGSPVADSDLPAEEIPEETAGPYPGDGSNGPDVLDQSGIVRDDIRSDIDGSEAADGVGLTFSLTVLNMDDDDAPFEGVAVYVWHCDASGGYSMYSEGLEDASYLRGVQVADGDGVVTFTSIFPACYSGRWPHIHFEVYPDVDSIDDYTNAIATSQLALPEDVCIAVYERSEYEGSSENLEQVSLKTDNVFGEDGGELQLADVTGDVDSGYTASLIVRVDTTTEAGSAEGAPGMGEGGPGEPGSAP